MAGKYRQNAGKIYMEAAIRMRGTKNRTHPFLCRKAGKTESIVSVQDGIG